MKESKNTYGHWSSKPSKWKQTKYINSSKSTLITDLLHMIVTK
jgi:hypothetical protein